MHIYVEFPRTTDSYRITRQALTSLIGQRPIITDLEGRTVQGTIRDGRIDHGTVVCYVEVPGPTSLSHTSAYSADPTVVATVYDKPLDYDPPKKNAHLRRIRAFRLPSLTLIDRADLAVSPTGAYVVDGVNGTCLSEEAVKKLIGAQVALSADAYASEATYGMATITNAFIKANAHRHVCFDLTVTADVAASLTAAGWNFRSPTRVNIGYRTLRQHWEGHMRVEDEIELRVIAWPMPAEPTLPTFVVDGIGELPLVPGPGPLELAAVPSVTGEAGGTVVAQRAGLEHVNVSIANRVAAAGVELDHAGVDSFMRKLAKVAWPDDRSPLEADGYKAGLTDGRAELRISGDPFKLGEPRDLSQVRARYAYARDAGIAADDADLGWDERKIRAVVRSYQDVAWMHDLLLHIRDDLNDGTVDDMIGAANSRDLMARWGLA